MRILRKPCGVSVVPDILMSNSGEKDNKKPSDGDQVSVKARPILLRNTVNP